MGWAKYAEDKYEAFCERQALKEGGEPVFFTCNGSKQSNAECKVKIRHAYLSE